MTLVAALPPTQHDPEQVREVAERVLARPEFGRSENVLRQLQDWVVERISDGLSALGSADGASALGWAVLVVVVGSALVLVVRFGRGIRRDPGVADATGDGSRWTADDWRRQAADRATRGDHRGALRAHHRALLAELGERALVHEVPGRTAGEYRGDIATAVPAASGPVEEATEVFERGVYGPGLPGADDVDRFAALARDVVASTGGGAAGR